jgi:transposase
VRAGETGRPRGRHRAPARPYFYLLEAEGFTCWLLNAKHVKNVPGRPKTDRLDAVWLAKVVERGMCRPSLVHPKPIRHLRDLTRYRRSLIRERTREKQRVEQLLEDAQIKLSSVISDIFGVSGRQMLQALIAGQLNPKALAQLARASMRSKIAVLEEALTGHFGDHHGFLCQLMLERIDAATTKIDQVTAEIDRVATPFAGHAQRLDAITGVGVVAAQELIAEIGVEMGHFPTAAHLVSWAKFAPSTTSPPAPSDAAPPGGATLAGRNPRRDRRRAGAHRHLPWRALPAPGPTPRQETRDRRGGQLGAHHRLAPARRPAGPLPRSRPRLLRVQDQPATPPT